MDGDWKYLPIPMLVSLAAAIAATPLVRRAAWRFRVLGYPDSERRFHPAPIPLLGGVAVYAALTAGLVTALALDRFRHAELAHLCWALLPTAALACLFGAIDDCRNLRWRAKIVLQLIAASTIAACGYSIDFIVVFGYPIELGPWGIVLTTLWLMGCINALNLIDGLDGLASVVGLSTTSMMGIIALSMGNEHVAVASLALTAALAGFLVYNRPPASIFLGDSGSTVIGLMIGVLSIQGTLKSSATLSITTPVVLMTLPMFDVVMAMVRRKLTGRPLALGDREHIHHCLLDRGWGPWQVLCIIGASLFDDGRGRHRRVALPHGRLGMDHRQHACGADDSAAPVRTPRIRPAGPLGAQARREPLTGGFPSPTNRLRGRFVNVRGRRRSGPGPSNAAHAAR